MQEHQVTIYPWGLTSDSSGRVHIVDNHRDRIYILDSKTGHLLGKLLIGEAMVFDEGYHAGIECIPKMNMVAVLWSSFHTERSQMVFYRMKQIEQCSKRRKTEI